MLHRLQDQHAGGLEILHVYGVVEVPHGVEVGVAHLDAVAQRAADYLIGSLALPA